MNGSVDGVSSSHLAGGVARAASILRDALGAQTCRRACGEYLAQMADVEPAEVEVVVDEIGPVAMTRIVGLTGATLPTAPTVCHECVWLAVPEPGAPSTSARWIRGTEEEWGAWGTVYYDDDGRLLGSMQYGPSDLFPRAAELPAGPPTEDAVLVTCAYLVDSSKPWVMQSLFLTAIGDARDKGARALEAFAYRYDESDSHVRAVSSAQDDLPAGLPGRLRLPDGARAGPRRARAPRARRPAAGRRGHARARAPRRARSVRAGAGAAAALKVAVSAGGNQFANAVRAAARS